MHKFIVGLSPSLVAIIALPSGNLLAYILPTRQWSVFGKSFTLNPGPFNRKEHALIAIMAVAISYYDSGGVSGFVWTALMKYFDMKLPLGYRFLFILTSQASCIGLAGMFHSVLVDPSYCVWPSALPTCTLIEGMHNKTFQNFTTNGWKMPRMKFFWIALAATTAFQFLPGYLFTGLSYFAWVTW
jgi:hypothetical protein